MEQGRDLLAPQPEGRDLLAPQAEPPTASTKDKATALKRGVDLGFSKAKIGAASLVLDALEAAGLDVSKGKEALDFAFEWSKDLTPEIEGTENSRKAGEFVGENAPYLLTPAGAGKTIFTTTAKAGAIGGGVGAAQFVDEGESRKANVGFGLLVGITSPVVFKAVESAVGRVIGSKTKVFNDDGTFTEEAVTKIKQAGETPDNIISFEVERLKRDGVLSPEELERFNQFKAEGLSPTRAEVTQRADDFQFQQEQAKTSGVIRDRLNETNRTLLDKGDELTSKTGIDAESAFSTGESVLGAIDEKALAVDNAVSEIYTQARAAAGETKNIRLNRLVDGLRKELPLSESRGNIAKSVTRLLKENGVIGDGFKVQARMDANQAEEVRKLLNKLSSENPKQAGLVRDLKEQLDLDVAQAVGKDAFINARKAHADFRKQLERVKRTKFDKNTKSAVLDLLEGKINPEQVFERVVLQKSTPRADVYRLRQFLTTGDGAEAGKQAWDNLRGETVRWVFNKASSGKNDLGDAVITGANLNKALDRIGDEKLKVLLTDAEYGALMRIKKIADLRTPVNGTHLGKGPSAQAISALSKRFPILGDIIDGVGAGRNVFKNRKAVTPEAETAKELSRPLVLPRPTGVTAAGVTGEEF